MLALTRRIGEKIVIDNGRIVITVIEVGSNRVRLGIECPKDVRVERPKLISEGI